MYCTCTVGSCTVPKIKTCLTIPLYSGVFSGNQDTLLALLLSSQWVGADRTRTRRYISSFSRSGSSNISSYLSIHLDINQEIYFILLQYRFKQYIFISIYTSRYTTRRYISSFSRSGSSNISSYLSIHLDTRRYVSSFSSTGSSNISS